MTKNKNKKSLENMCRTYTNSFKFGSNDCFNNLFEFDFSVTKHHLILQYDKLIWTFYKKYCPKIVRIINCYSNPC